MKCDRCQNKPFCYDGNHELTKYGCLENGEYCFAPITNGDRIRAMTDEELAKFFEEHCYQYGWLDWLKQESKE